MNFKTYLLENYQTLDENHSLAYQMLIDNLDNTHIEYDDKKALFNIGHAIQNPQFDQLEIAIFKSDSEKVDFAKRKSNGKHVIVIFTPNYPDRNDIDSFLSSHNKIMRNVTGYMKKFEIDFMDKSIENKNYHDTDFEKNYDNLITAIKKRVKDYDKVYDELKSKMDKNSGNHGLTTSVKLAMDNLKSETFGVDAKTFLGKLTKEPEGEFIKSLSKELKLKLENRLNGFFKDI